MKTYARKVGDHIIDVTTSDPSLSFHRDLVEEFFEVPDGVENGAVLIHGEWKNPMIVPPAEQAPTVTIEVFWTLFGLAEWDEARKIANEQSMVGVLFLMLDDPRTETVSLEGHATEIATIINLLGCIPLDKKSMRYDQVMSATPVHYC
jgi:hypothetical protein